MRHMALTLLLDLLALIPFLFASPVGAQATESSVANKLAATDASMLTSSFYLAGGYRMDNLNWNIAGNRQGGDPNVLSELSWSHVTIYQLKLTNRTVIMDWVYLRWHVDCGIVVSGDNQDSDYLGDNRTEEFSRSINGVDGNHVWDGSIGGGPHLSLFESTVTVCPILGYAIAEQDFNIVDGYQVLTTPPSATPLGPIEHLDSRYQTRWRGPWIGVDLLLSMPIEKGLLRRVEVLFSGEYHWVDYSADANWNLRTDLAHPVSFSHDAQGTGMKVGTTIRFDTQKRWGFELGMNMIEMTTDPGVDRIYQADGSIGETRLNEVKWRAFTVEAGLGYQF